MLAAFSYSGGTYQQSFDGLGTTNSTVTNRDLENVSPSLAGWFFNETGTGANTMITAGTGSANSGDTYNVGASGSATDRALGGLQSGSVIPSWGFQLTNNSGNAIAAVNIAYTGQTWRVGAVNRSDRIDFQYSLDATSLSTGTWTDVDSLDYANPGQAATATAGGTVIHSQVVSGLLGSLNLASGASLFIRWTDFNALGADDLIAINDFSLSPGAVSAPTVSTPTSATVTSAGATLGGTVASDGGANVTERGVVYAIKADNASPEIGGTGATKVAAAAGGTGTFTVPVTGLAAGTLYVFKAYATNSAGTTYTEVAEFTTGTEVVAPTVTSPTSASILDVEALLGGTVTSDGGATVTERGIVIALTADNVAPEIGGAGVTKVVADAAGTGTFTKLVTGLAAASGYTFRAYATNSVGTAYSDAATFTTNVAATAPVIGSPTKFVLSTTGTLGGDVTGSGGRPVTERGVVFAKTDDNADPQIDGVGVTKVAGVLGIGTGIFTVGVTGLEPLTGYSFKAYATNGVGTSYTTVDTFTTYATETSLTAGDIAFTGYQTDDPDGYSFVLLKDVVAGTTVTFTDNGWAVGQSGFFATSENTQIVQFGSAYAAGTHFQVVGGDTPTFTVIGSGANAGNTSGALSGLSTSGDSILAYQGAVPTSGSATNWIAGLNSKPWATAAFTGTNESALPTALTNGTTAIGFATEEDNGAYNRLTFVGTAASVRADVNNTANWTRAANAGPTSTTAFTVATIVTSTTLSVSSSNVNYGSALTFSGTVAATSGSVSPAGSIEIRDGGASGTLLALTSLTLNGDGTSTYSVLSTTVPTGAYSDVRAYFVPTGVFIDSASEARSLTVNAVGATTTTSLASISPLTSTAGTAVTLAGTIVASTGSATPVGTVEIRDGGPTGKLLASTSTIGGSGPNGTFSIVTSSIPIGAYTNVKAYFTAASQVDFLDSQSEAFSGGTLTVNAAAFTPGNLLVLRVGDGATAIVNGTPGNVTGGVTLLEITPAGVLVQAIPVASSGGSAATLRLNSTSEGSLSLSADRQTVTFGGFRVDAGPTNPNTGSAGRVIAKIGVNGAIDTTQVISGVFGDNSFRSVVTDNGTNFWLSGAGTNGGIQYVAGPSATTATTLTSGSDNVRQVQILDGNLFVSSGSAAPGRSVFQVGVGLPTTPTATQTATFTPSGSAQYQSYFFADLDTSAGWRNTGYDTLYAADGNGSIVKFSYVVTSGVGAWNASGSVPFTSAANLAGFVSEGTVTLYATSALQDLGSLVSLTDTTGYNADFSSTALSTLASTTTNYAFRGVSFVPRSGISTTTTVTGISPTTAEQADSVTFTATVAAGSGTARPTGTVQFRSGAVLLATATLADGADAVTGVASITVPMAAIPVGTYSVTAQYVPDGNPSLNLFNPGTSAAFATSLVIQAPGVVTTTTLSDVNWAAKPSAAAYGDAITFGGRVATADSSTPVGTVEIRSGGPAGTLLASTSTFAADGSFTITTSAPIPSSTYAGLAAHFVGATGFKGSSSAESSTVLEISSTVLSAGDIAFTGFKVTGTDEKISFVLLKSVIAGTTLTITDNAWTGTALTTAEGTSTITFTQAFTAGTQVDYDATRATGAKWQTSGSAVGISDVTPVALALGNSGDNVFAYQGNAPTSGSAAGWIAAFSSQAFLSTGSSTANVTYLPSALTLGDTAFTVDLTLASLSQNAWLNDLGTVTNTASGLRAAIYTLSNWTAGPDSATTTPVVPSPTVFVLGSATPAIGTTGTLSAISTLLGTASSPSTVAVTGTNLTADIVATAPAGFEVSSDGTTFGSTATFARSGTSVNGTLSVRLAAATAVGTYSGNVSLASTGATGVTVAIPTSTVTDELVFDVADGQTVTDAVARSGAIKLIKRGLGTLILNLANSHSGATTVEAGTLRLSAADALASSAVSVGTGGTLLVDPGLTIRTPTLALAGGTLAASGVTLLVNATTGIATFAIASGSVTGSPGLTVSGNGVMTLPTDRRQIVDVASLSIDQAGGGRIDIGKGRINVAADGTTEADLRADVIAGRNGGAFNGTSGIMTTGGKASPTSTNPVVGYRVLPNRTAIVAWAAYGDANLDGQVSNSDVTNILNGQKFGKGSSTGATWSQGDFNYSGGVTQTDITLFNGAGLSNKGSYLPVTPTAASLNPTTTLVAGSLSAEVWAAYAVSLETPQQTKKR